MRSSRKIAKPVESAHRAGRAGPFRQRLPDGGIHIAHGLNDKPPAQRARSSLLRKAYGILDRMRQTSSTATPTCLPSKPTHASATRSARACSRTSKRARVHLGAHLTLLFEDRLTIQYQVQEMLRIERIFEHARHRRRTRRLQPADSGRQQPQGDDADRVRRRRGAQARSWRSCAASRIGSRCSVGGAAAGATRSPTRTSIAATKTRPRPCISCASS